MRGGGCHGVRRYFIRCRVDERQRAYIREKASEYGITLSELMLRSVEAYTRVYDADAGACALVAVNYGVWTRALVALTGIDEALRECAQQVAGLRRMLSTLESEGGLGQVDVTRAEGLLTSCLSEVREARKRTESGVEVLEALHGAACVTDFAVGVERNTISSGGREG